jgi:hypothetical protein
MGETAGWPSVLGAVSRGSMHQTAIDAKSSIWSPEEEKDARNAAA